MPAIKVRDNGEPLVDVKKIVPGIKVWLGRRRNAIEPTAYLRETVARMLREAQKELPRGYHFALRDAWRPRYEQVRIYHWFLRTGRKRHPTWSEKKIVQAIGKYVAPWEGTDASGHLTGGAMDIRIMDARGRRIPMRTTKLSYEENALSVQPKLPAHLRRNRELMATALRSAGLSNYPLEYWHWSYGDYQWAKRTGAKTAIYAPVADVNGLYADRGCPCESGKPFMACHAG